MKILLLSCSTGEGHNHCALAVKEALDAAGHETSFLDMLHMFGDPGPLSFDKLLNRISSRTPEVFGMMTRGEVALIVAQKGLEVGVVEPVYFTAVILLIVVSSVATPLALKALFTKMPPVPHPSEAKK